MPWTSKHLKWLVRTIEIIKTVDGKTIEVWEFRHNSDATILSAWAKHFRNHYCLDSEIDYFRKGYKYSRSQYLNEMKFPDASCRPGPSIRAGDFGEILIADYLEYVLNYWVPRTRYSDKDIRNESTKGTDIVGFKFMKEGQTSLNDAMVIFETKTQFSGKRPKPKLQEAVTGSAIDQRRKAESLNAIKRRLYNNKKLNEAERIERFQQPEAKPYKEISGAAALFSTSLFDQHSIEAIDTRSHPNSENLLLIVIRGNDMMTLVHELYRRAADEA